MIRAVLHTYRRAAGAWPDAAAWLPPAGLAWSVASLAVQKGLGKLKVVRMDLPGLCERCAWVSSAIDLVASRVLLNIWQSLRFLHCLALKLEVFSCNCKLEGYAGLVSTLAKRRCW